MPDSHPDDGFDLTEMDVQSIDVRALQAELARLRGENSRLRAQLDGTSRAAAVEAAPSGVPTSSESVESSLLSPRARVELFRRLFRGRTDTFPIRWHSVTSGKSGYAPACSNEWVRGVCEKPRVKCADCEIGHGPIRTLWVRRRIVTCAYHVRDRGPSRSVSCGSWLPRRTTRPVHGGVSSWIVWSESRVFAEGCRVGCVIGRRSRANEPVPWTVDRRLGYFSSLLVDVRTSRH